MATLLIESSEAAGKRCPVQVFGSDVNDVALETARMEVYPETIAVDISVDRLERFFTKRGQTYQLDKRLRETVIFSRQNLLVDSKGQFHHFHGQTEKYLSHPTGQASQNILDMTSGTLSARLRHVSDQALQQVEPVAIPHVPAREGERMANQTVMRLPGDGQEAIQQAHLHGPDVVIMDLSMPVMNGVEATRRMKAELPGTQIIGLSTYEEGDQAKELLQAGARAYLDKGAPSEDLIAAIRAAAAPANS